MSHHCGFDFKAGESTAVCKCGAIASNPFVYPIKEHLDNLRKLRDELIKGETE